MNEESTAALALLARMRAACGDNGTRMQDELEEYLRKLRADAERYRWLRDHCRHSAEHWGGRWSIVVEGRSPEDHDISFDAAIDAAMKGANTGLDPKRAG